MCAFVRRDVTVNNRLCIGSVRGCDVLYITEVKNGISCGEDFFLERLNASGEDFCVGYRFFFLN